MPQKGSASEDTAARQAWQAAPPLTGRLSCFLHNSGLIRAIPSVHFSPL